jgi:hypothetical protein
MLEGINFVIGPHEICDSSEDSLYARNQNAACTPGFLAVKGVALVAVVYVGARLAIRHERSTTTLTQTDNAQRC